MSLTLMETRVLERLQCLPRDRVEEVIDYIDFLLARESTPFLAGRLAASLAQLDEMDLPVLAGDDLLSREPGRVGNGVRSPT